MNNINKQIKVTMKNLDEMTVRRHDRSDEEEDKYKDWDYFGENKSNYD